MGQGAAKQVSHNEVGADAQVAIGFQIVKDGLIEVKDYYRSKGGNKVGKDTHEVCAHRP
jgi:hypothetical protein